MVLTLEDVVRNVSVTFGFTDWATAVLSVSGAEQGGTGCHLGTPPSLAGPPPAHAHPSTLRSHLQVEAFLTLWEIESGPSGLSRAHESHVGHSYRHILIFVCAEVCAEFMRWSTVTC